MNEDATEKLIANLKEENARLKKMLESGKMDAAMMASIGADSNQTKAEGN